MNRPFIVILTLQLVLSSGHPLASENKLHPASSSILGTPVATLSNVNNMSIWLRDDGWGARDPDNGNAGFTFPRQTTTAVYQHGILWGGNINDGRSPVLRVGGQTYSPGTVSGKIIAPGIPENPNDTTVRIYRVRPDFATADLLLDAAEINRVSPGGVTQLMIALVRAQYSRDWNEWPAIKGAPYLDVNGNGTYDPSTDIPGIPNAGQTVWFVANDLDSARALALYGSRPIGLEMQATIWSYGLIVPPYANVVFKREKLIYKGTMSTPPNATISNMYLTQWVDPDVGDSGDDFAGCDSSLGLAFGYNSTNTDAEYGRFGLHPPAIGYKVVQGPIVPGGAMDTAIFDLRKRAGFKNLPVTASIYFAAGGTYSDPPFNYDGTLQWYNLMQGLTPITGAPFIHPRVPGVPTKFWLDGDPLTGTGRVDGVIDLASDRRIASSCGPFTMAVGDTQEIVVAMIAGIGSNYLTGVSLIKSYSATVQHDYNGLLHTLTGVAPLHSEIPGRSTLEQNYPNPFNPSTAIPYQVASRGRVTLKIFDLLGREVQTLVDEERGPGTYSARWDGSHLTSGVYFYQLTVGGYRDVRKMMLLK